MTSTPPPTVGTAPAGPPGRLHFLDGLRGALMVLGVPFHAAIALSGLDWVVRNDEQSVPLQVLAAFLHLWRMPAFFVVAGFFAVLVLRRREPGRWFRERLERLGLPLLTGLLLINPVQTAIRARSELGSWSAVADGWFGLYLRGGAVHLWFLRDLLLYCLVLALVVASPLRSSLARVVDRTVARVIASAWLTAAAALVAGASVVVMLAAWRLSGIGGATEVVLTNQVLTDAPFFVVGAALGVRPERLRPLAGRALAPTVLITAACLAVFVPAELGLLGPGTATDAVVAVVATVGGLSGAAVVVGLALRHGDRDHVAVTWVVDSSLVVYLVHHVVVLAMAAWLISTDVPALVAFVPVVLVALVVSVLVYEGVNATPGLRYLLTGRRSRATGLVDVLRARRRGPRRHLRGPPVPVDRREVRPAGRGR